MTSDGTGEVEIHRTTCNRDCPDACSILVTVKSGRAVKLGGDPAHPVTRGFLCYRTNRFLETQYSPERLRTPLLRKGEHLVPVSWEEALDVAAARLQELRERVGPAAVFHYRSGGSLGLLKGLSDYFFQQWGPVTQKRGDICSGAGEAAQEADFGVCDSSDLDTLLASRHILLWGKNVHTSSPHTLIVLKDAQARGARIVLIDPVLHAGKRLAESTIQPAPGGDFALAMAVASYVFELGLVDPDAASYCDYLPEFEALVRSRPRAAWCAEADVSEVAARDLAQRLGERPCAILVGWGMGRRSNGGAIVRAIDALCAITGNLGIEGGGASFYFRRRSAFNGALPPIQPPRTVCEPLFAQELETLSDPPLRALWVTAGNPVAMLPDSARIARAIAALDFSVVVDSWLSDTARVASLVLPTTTLLEDDDLVGAYGHHYLGVSQPAVQPPSGVKSDLEILQALGARLGCDVLAGSARVWKERFVNAHLAQRGVSLERLEEGAVRNPLAQRVLFADRKFPTSTGRVQLVHQAPSAPRSDADYPLVLMALSTPHSQSSQWANTAPAPLPVAVHPDAANGIADGARCRLESRNGTIVVRLRHDAGLRRDVLLAPKGGHFHLGASANALLKGRMTDLGEGGVLYEERVRLVHRDK